MGIMSDCLITPVRFDIIDTRSNEVVASRLTRKRAFERAAQLDDFTGWEGHVVKPIWANEVAA